MADRVTVSISVVTYRRPQSLSELLPLLQREMRDLPEDLSARFELDIVVVDNDVAETARTVCELHDDVPYVTEARPGISAARNRALSVAAASRVIVFIDDDERPRPGWLGSLLQLWITTRAAAISGPVVPVFPGVLDSWIAEGGFNARSHQAGLRTGDQIRSAATNNLLLDMRLVRSLGLRFDEDYGLTGGEDTMFTRSLHRSGGVLLWCAEAVVEDVVPLERMTRSYVLRRTYNLSNATTAVELAIADSAERPRLLLRTAVLSVVRVVAGSVRACWGTLTGGERNEARGRRMISRGRGSAAALLGRRAIPYARLDKP